MTTLRLLIAASGTGGHLFPALAVAEVLPDYHIEWLGVPDRLETSLLRGRYPLHTVAARGFQSRSPLSMGKTIYGLGRSVFQIRHLLQNQGFAGVFTTGGYIAGPAIMAARSLGLPVILHESNALPGKVTRWFSPWCTEVALGVESAAQYLPRTRTVYVGTPVRPDFLLETPPSLDLPIPADAPLLVIVGGSQGAVSVNQLVRTCASDWLEAGIWIVHLTGDVDPDRAQFQHPHYFALPFYDRMAALLHRADLAISRAGAGTLTELAITHTPSILIPYPYAAEDHQTYNAAIFGSVGAAIVFQQSDLSADQLREKTLFLLNPQNKAVSQQMAEKSGELAVHDSAHRMATHIRQVIRD
ncbi:MAG: undecaprenyldiphospho-muramoylpentapeptide beta-N-acetylglucosaminyltransferase [Prochlorotrichaceae cyanobacterium]